MTTLHPRRLVREAIRQALLWKTSAEERVSTTRVQPFQAAVLPAILITTYQERSEASNADQLERELEVGIEAYIKASVGLEDELDAVALAIERAIAVDDTLGSVASVARLSGTAVDLDVMVGDQPAGAIRLAYGVVYYTDLRELAEGALGDLKTVHVTHDLGSTQEAAVQAQDHLTDLDA